jgi:hypothetical protein
MLTKNISGIWLLIALYIAVIYLTLPLMRPVLNYLYSSVGKGTLSVMVNLSLGIASASIVLLSVKRGLPRALLIGILLVIAALFIYGMDRPEERIHFLEYGVLGFMVLKGMKEHRHMIVLSFVFVALVGAVDELIQWLLPNRVGDLRDIAMNAAGGMLGIWTGKLLQ